MLMAVVLINLVNVSQFRNLWNKNHGGKLALKKSGVYFVIL
jgi:hypothetical protein